jgi:NADH-quinone oxidoreductase subunit L
MTHAFFKAVLFLGAGSVIIALHHEQDMRRMGGLKEFMPITYWTVLVGAVASAGIPPFAGFFSKDAIIEAARLSATPGAGFAYACVLACVFVTAAYTFRMVFMAFHGAPRFDAGHAPHESPRVVTVPLVLLAIPSALAGWLIGSFVEIDSLRAFLAHGLVSPPFWLALAGIGTAWWLYRVRTDLPKKIALRLGPVYAVVERKYGFDELYAWLFGAGARVIGTGLWKAGDQTFIDGLAVNGSARLVGWFSSVVRLLQSGLLTQYAFAMILGVFVFLSLWLART